MTAWIITGGIIHPDNIPERPDKDAASCSTSQFVYERFLAQPDREGAGDGELDHERENGGDSGSDSDQNQEEEAFL